MVALMHRIDFHKKRRKNKTYITACSAPMNTFITSVSNKTGFVKLQLELDNEPIP